MSVSYDSLRRRLEAEFTPDREPVRVAALPDGSVDYLYAVDGTDGARIETPAELGRQLTGDAATFPVTPIDVQPGGQAVNAAMQIHELGADATLVGYLDHPVFDELEAEFDAHSMGTPATIRIVAFDDSEVLFPEPGPTDDWDIAALDAVVDWNRVARADAICCVNWASVRGLTDVFERLASRPPAAESLPIVVDPGAIGLPDEAAVESFFETLSRTDAAADSLSIVLSVNPTEFDVAASAVGVDDGESTLDRLAAVRTALDVTGVVIHGSEAAHAATRGGDGGSGGDRSGGKDGNELVTVDMLEITDPQFTTGAGDRFSGAVACALARGWEWELALALGNACAAHFVATAETATPERLRSFVDAHR